MMDPREQAKRLRDISDHCDGHLSSTITRQPVGTKVRPPRVGSLVWAAEWEADGTLYRVAVESHGPDGGRLWRDAAKVAREVDLPLDVLLPSAHKAVGCEWRPLPVTTIGDVVRSDPEGLGSLAGRTSEAEVSRCSDLLTAVAIAIDRLAGEVSKVETTSDSTKVGPSDVASILDENAPAIVQIAEDTGKSLEERMRLIAIAKSGAGHWKSPRWAELLGVTASRIRQTDTWIAWRAAEKKPD